MAITDDAVEDDGETPTLTLSNAPGAGIADGTATGTIRNAEESSDPLTTSFESVPAEHDGSRAFSFRVRFSEDVKVSYWVLRDEAFIVSGGTVTNARPVGGRNDPWEILLQRDGPDEINVTLLATSSCDDAGAICISDRQPLSNSPSATVAGPPAISGTAQVSERLQASTSGIADADGLDGAAFAYQWIRGGEDIGGATGSSYRLVDADEGERIKVRVTFTDDARNDESLTSEATDAVAPNRSR